MRKKISQMKSAAGKMLLLPLALTMTPEAKASEQTEETKVGRTKAAETGEGMAVEKATTAARLPMNKIESLKEVSVGENPAQHVIFLDGNGAIFDYPNKAIEGRSLRPDSLETILAMQNAGALVYMITAHSPEDQEKELESLTQVGLDFTKSPQIENFDIPDRSFYKGIFFSPRRLLAQGETPLKGDGTRTVTKPATMKKAIELLRQQGHPVSQISYVITGKYNFNTVENQGFDVPVGLYYFEEKK